MYRNNVSSSLWKNAIAAFINAAKWRAELSRPSAARQRPMAYFLFTVPVLVTGCVQEMADQPRIESYEASTFFEDGQGSRLPVAGTIARGELQLDTHFYRGIVDGEPAREFPEAFLTQDVPQMLLKRGRERFNIFCAHCHGRVGGGSGGRPEYQSLVGMVVRRGFPMPPTFHQARLREAPAGHFFDVITRGFGRMPAHDYLIPAADRWAIVAYIRALQLSQHAPLDAADDSARQRLASTIPREAR